MSRFSIGSWGRPVQIPPVLSDFEIAPPLGVHGTDITLTWNASGHRALVLTTPSGRRLNLPGTAEASAVLKLESSGTFQLAARNDYGTVVATFDVLMLELPGVTIPDAPVFSEVFGQATTISDSERAAVMEVSDGYGLLVDLLSIAPESMPGTLPSIQDVMRPRRAVGDRPLSSPYDVVDSAMRDAGAGIRGVRSAGQDPPR